MDDLISRQEAIAATRNAKISFTIKSDIDFANYRKEIQEMFNNILDAQEKALKELPSAQPEPSDVARDIATIIENEKDMRVIAAQPEIIRCKECRWWDKYDDYDIGYCMAAKHGYWSGHWEISIRRTYKGDFYCADAERRTYDLQ